MASHPDLSALSSKTNRPYSWPPADKMTDGM